MLNSLVIKLMQIICHNKIPTGVTKRRKDVMQPVHSMEIGNRAISLKKRQFFTVDQVILNDPKISLLNILYIIHNRNENICVC